MNVASLDLCEELYELSGWGDTIDQYMPKITGRPKADGTRYITYNISHSRRSNALTEAKEKLGGDIPAYDLGYLLRKLPYCLDKPNDKGYFKYLVLEKQNGGFLIEYRDVENEWTYRLHANTPEDAACKLAIELFKQKVLTA